MKKLVGEGMLYPSRSELVRVAVREFLIRELNKLENPTLTEEEKEPEIDNTSVRIPIAKITVNGKSVNAFKTFKILKRLESPEKKVEKPIVEYEQPRVKKEPINTNVFWEDKSGIFRISKENPNLVYIQGIGLTQKINEFPT